MISSGLDLFLKKRDIFYDANAKNKRIWYTSLVTGNFRNTILYSELTGTHQPFRLRPLWGFLRYCLIDMPFRRRQRMVPEGQLLVATVFMRQKNQQNAHKITEAFFADLPTRLQQSGSPVICIGKVAHHFSRRVEEQARDNLGNTVFCPTHLLTKWDGLKIVTTALCSLLSCRYPSDTGRKVLAKEMIRSHISEVLSALLYEAMIAKIISKNPRIPILHPFEGNTWESACSLSGQYCIGYQHSSILNDQFKISCFSGRPIPSRIITTGPEASRQLSELWGYPNTLLVDGYSLRQAGIYQVHPKTEPPRTVNRILVLMQGEEHRNGALECLRKLMKLRPNIKVCLRPHPAVPITKMGIDYKTEFLISDEPDLYVDILRHDACVYISSTAALESIYLGVPVIHLIVDSDIDSDPLVGISYLKRDAKIAEEIVGYLQEFEGYPRFEEEFTLARGYFEGYFRKPDNFMEERFKEWLALSSA